MKKIFFVLIVSFLMQSNAFSAGNEIESESLKRKRDEIGEDSFLMENSVNKKHLNIKNKIIHDLEYNTFDLSDYSIFFDDFYEEGSKTLLDPDLMYRMQEELIKASQNNCFSVRDRYRCAKLLFLSTAKDFFDPNQVHLAHHAAGITAIEEISQSCPIDILESILEEKNSELVSFVLQKIKNHFVYKFCKSKDFFLEDVLPELREDLAAIFMGSEFLKLDSFIQSFTNADYSDARHGSKSKLCSFIKFYFGKNPEIFDYFNLFKVNDSQNSIFFSLKAIHESAIRYGLANLVCSRDLIIERLSKIVPKDRLIMTNYATSILEKEINSENIVFLLDHLRNCSISILPDVVKFLGKFSWNGFPTYNTSGHAYDFSREFLKMIHHINKNIKKFESFSKLLEKLNVKNKHIKIPVDLYQKIYFENDECSEKFINFCNKDNDILSFLFDQSNYYWDNLLKNPHHHEMIKAFEYLVSWSNKYEEEDIFSIIYDPIKDLTKDNLQNIADTMKEIKKTVISNKRASLFLGNFNRDLLLCYSKSREINAEEYFKKVNEFVLFLKNNINAKSKRDFTNILTYLQSKSNILFMSDEEKLCNFSRINLNIKDLTISDFLKFFNIFENFNDKEYKQFLDIFSLDEIKNIPYLYIPRFADFIKFLMKNFSNHKIKTIIENMGEYFEAMNFSYTDISDFELLKKIIYFADTLPDSLFDAFAKDITDIAINVSDKSNRENNYSDLIYYTLKYFYKPLASKYDEELIGFLKKTIQSSDELLVSGVSRFINTYCESMGMTAESEFVQLSIRVGILLDQSDDPKSPYKVHRDLENKRKSEINFECLRQFQFVKGDSREYQISLNPSFFKKLSEIQVDLDSTPHIAPSIIGDMFDSIKSRLNADISSEIETITEMTFENLKAAATGQDNYLQNLLKCENSYIAAQFKCILNNLSMLNGEDGRETKLSTQEMAIVKTFASILECGTGRDGAINEAYLQLDNEFKLKNLTNNVFDSIVMDRNLAPTSKACEFLYVTLNGLVENMFSGTNDLMLEISQEEAIEDISQAVHQGLYLRNLIGDLVGSWHRVKFDINAGLFYESLLALSRQEALDLFYKHAHTSLKDLITIIHSKINNQINTLEGAVLYNELFKLLNEDKNSFELDENDAPIITLDGTIKVLIKIGALEQNNRLF
ncbi:MAG: hypothetical protein Q8S31_09955 [Alphaproteobacteria bacterium]|nr:hypothetical protein [Alphaproteobacteria bacterium]